MKSTTDFHNHIVRGVFPKANSIFDDATSFDTRHNMFYTHATMSDLVIFLLLFGLQWMATWFFMRLGYGDRIHGESQKTQILYQFTARRKRIRAFTLRNDFIMHPSFIGVAHPEDRPFLGCDHDIFDRMAFFLSAVPFLLAFGVGRSGGGAFGRVMKKREGTSNPDAASRSTKAACWRVGASPRVWSVCASTGRRT